MTQPWFVSQSHYTQGFTCPWSRLLKYHWQGKGIYPVATKPALEAGTQIHETVEALYHHWTSTGQLPTRADVTLQPPTTLSWALAHAYARCVMPWVVANYDPISIEKEYTLDLGSGIHWMARPDVVVRNKKTGALAEISLKSTAARPEQIVPIHTGSLQTIMNAHVISQAEGSPVEAVQIHLLLRGSDTYPSPLTHAYYRPSTGYTPDDWQPHSKKKGGGYLGKLYSKVEVAKHRPLPDWIWTMPEDACQDQVPIALNHFDPDTHALKVSHVLHSIRYNEVEWQTIINNIDWKQTSLATLDRLVPRSFQCIQYNDQCDYASVCFDIHDRTQNLILPTGFKFRTPHHPQEIVQSKEEKK